MRLNVAPLGKVIQAYLLLSKAISFHRFTQLLQILLRHDYHTIPPTAHFDFYQAQSLLQVLPEPFRL